MTPPIENTTQETLDFRPKTEQNSTNAIPYGYCHCGCGEKTSVPTYTHRTHNIIKGIPSKYVSGHNRSMPPLDANRPHRDARRCACGGWRDRMAEKCRDCWNKDGKPPEDPETYIINGKPRRRIALTQGQYAIVDAKNYDRMNKFNYYAHRNRHGNGSYYAKRSISIGGGKCIPVPMQYDVMTPNPGEIIDHIDPIETLNNCEDNLRSAPQRFNTFNRRRHSNNTSGRKNVHKRGNKWIVRITAFGTEHTSRLFDTFEEACASQEESVRIIHGEFANIGDN